MAVYPNNIILNSTEISRKINGNGKDAGNNILNKSEIEDIAQVSPYIAIVDGIPNNIQVQRRYYFKSGFALIDAYRGSYDYYTQYDPTWDADISNNIDVNHQLYDANFQSFATKDKIYMLSDGTWFKVGSNGKIVSRGIFTPIDYSGTWIYASSYADYYEEVHRAWESSKQETNDDYLYYYGTYSKWYSKWTYETPIASNGAEGIYMRYINAARVHYRRFHQVVEQSDSNREGYIVAISMLLQGSTSISSSSQTLTYNITTNVGVAWKASITSGGYFATITSGASGVGTGGLQQIQVQITGNGSSSRSFTLAVTDVINGGTTISRTKTCTQASSYLRVYPTYLALSGYGDFGVFTIETSASYWSATPDISGVIVEKRDNTLIVTQDTYTSELITITISAEGLPSVIVEVETN